MDNIPFSKQTKGAVMNTNKRILIFAITALLAIGLLGCSFSVSTANIEDAIMTDSIDGEGKPGNTVTSYAADAGVFYTSAKLRNAPDNTKIRFVWIYDTTGETIQEVNVDSGDISDRYIYSSISLDTLYPEGDYEVQYFVDERTEPDATVKFRVTPAVEMTGTVDTSGAYVEDVHMTSGFDSNGQPMDSIVTVPSTGIWYVSAVLRNTQTDTIIHYVWYDTNNNIIDEYDLDPQGATDVYINGSMELASTAPSGEYWVELYINDSTMPAAQVGFNVE